MMRKRWLPVIAVVAIAAYVYLEFEPVQVVKLAVAENLYATKLVKVEEKHAEVEALLEEDMAGVVKAGGGSDILDRLAEALEEEEKQLHGAGKIGEFQSSLPLSGEYTKLVELVAEADNLREEAFETWKKAVTMWKSMRVLVEQFERTRKQIAETSVAWKEEGVTQENLDKVKQSLAEMEELKRNVDEMAEEDVLTKDLIAFFSQGFSDFEKMRESIVAFEEGREEEGEKLAEDLAKSVKGVRVADSERLLSLWVKNKLVPLVEESEEMFEKERLKRANWEMVRREVREGGGVEEI